MYTRYDISMDKNDVVENIDGVEYNCSPSEIAIYNAITGSSTVEVGYIINGFKTDKEGTIKIPDNINGYDVIGFCREAAPDSEFAVKAPNANEIIFPKHCVYVGEYFFYKTNFKSCIFSDELKCLEGYSWAYSGLESVFLPKSVADVKEFAFYGCDYLTDIECEEIGDCDDNDEPIATFKSNCFGGLANLASFTTSDIANNDVHKHRNKKYAITKDDIFANSNAPSILDLHDIISFRPINCFKGTNFGEVTINLNSDICDLNKIDLSNTTIDNLIICIGYYNKNIVDFAKSGNAPRHINELTLAMQSPILTREDEFDPQAAAMETFKLVDDLLDYLKVDKIRLNSDLDFTLVPYKGFSNVAKKVGDIEVCGIGNKYFLDEKDGFIIVQGVIAGITGNRLKKPVFIENNSIIYNGIFKNTQVKTSVTYGNNIEFVEGNSAKERQYLMQTPEFDLNFDL